MPRVSSASIPPMVHVPEKYQIRFTNFGKLALSIIAAVGALYIFTQPMLPWGWGVALLVVATLFIPGETPHVETDKSPKKDPQTPEYPMPTPPLQTGDRSSQLDRNLDDCCNCNWGRIVDGNREAAVDCCDDCTNCCFEVVKAVPIVETTSADDCCEACNDCLKECGRCVDACKQCAEDCNRCAVTAACCAGCWFCSMASVPIVGRLLFRVGSGFAH